jgi:hypothetical protein
MGRLAESSSELDVYQHLELESKLNSIGRMRGGMIARYEAFALT